MTREEAILLLHDMKDRYDEIHENTNFEIGYEQMTALDMAIEALSADAVQGEWIWRTDIPIGDGRTSAGYICSHCGKDYWHGNKLKFCPNCGAKMKGGGDE